MSEALVSIPPPGLWVRALLCCLLQFERMRNTEAGVLNNLFPSGCFFLGALFGGLVWFLR